MDNDDRQIGRILSRREVLTLIGAGAAALLVGCGPGSTTATQATSAAGTTPATQPTTAASTAVSEATTTPALNAEAETAAAQANDPSAVASASAEVAAVESANATVEADATGVPSCVVRPEVTEGPYYVEEDLVRSDIRSDPTTGTVKEGAPLVLTFNVSQVNSGSCAALEGATVEIWHCDADGQYSDVSDRSFDTTGQKWLRGAQPTDASGKATFTTIYPGWYRGRAVHIHFKVHAGSSKVFTSQLFFDDALSDQVFTQAPYAAKGQRDQLNSSDNIYKEQLLLTTTKSGDGYAATFDIGMQTA